MDTVSSTSYTSDETGLLTSYVNITVTSIGQPRQLGYEFKKWVYTTPEGKDADVKGSIWSNLIESAMVDSQGNNVIVLRGIYEKIEPEETKKSSPKNYSSVDGKGYASGSVIMNRSFFGNA